nr:MAG TPA: hypothetical protein [Caudoviricetes sp.]
MYQLGFPHWCNKILYYRNLLLKIPTVNGTIYITSRKLVQ